MSQGHKTKERLIHLKDVSWQRLVESEKAVERSFQQGRLVLSLAAGLILVGFLLVAQWRGIVTYGQQSERQTDQDLAIVVQELTEENGALRDEVMRLELRLFEAQANTQGEGEVLNEAAKELNALRVMSGLQTALGPGVNVIVTDPEGMLLPEDFTTVVHELRAGGAEAIAVNGRRVSARTGFSGYTGYVEMEGVPLTRDYRVTAIGNAANLEQSLTLPGGIQSVLEAFPGVEVEIEQADELRVAGGEEQRYVIGTPVAEE
jgi:uncharacterized protein YlxW (UPF0749 family)